MIKKNKKTKKSIILIVSFLAIFALNIWQARAFSLPTPSEVASELESRYHVDLGSIQNMGENFNVSSSKDTVPQVTLLFDPANPKPGEKITAKAMPMFFTNTNSSLYFTWYLKHKTGNQDLNKDGRVDIEDYKIEAMRIIADGDFDSSRIDYDTTTDNDHDGYQATYGGDGTPYKNADDAHCYVHDFKSGVDSELANGCQHLFPETNGHGTVGDDSFGLDEEKFWGTDPNDPSTAKNGNSDEANVVGLGQDSFTWTYEPGDQVGVVVEGTSMMPTKYNDSSDMIMWALPKNKCTLKGSNTEDQIQCSDPTSVSACVNTTNNVDFSGGSSDPLYSCLSTGETPQCISGSAQCSSGLPKCVSSTGGNTIDSQHACDSSQVSFNPDPNYLALSLETPDCVQQTSDSGGVQTGSKAISSKGYSVSIPTTDIDINDCLEDNLVDPMQGGQASKLDVSLTYSPDNPLNDPTSDNSGDTVSVQSSIDNSEQNPNQQLYDWSVEISKDGTFNGDFTDITKKLLDGKLISGPIEGNGLSSLNFQLNLNTDVLGISQQTFNSYFPDGVGYIKVTAKASENFSSGTVQYGQSDVIIKVTSSDKKIEAYNTKINDDGTVGINDNSSNIICPGSSTCYVTKDQIVGLKVDEDGLSNYSWTLNNEPLVCNPSISSSDCNSTSATNYNFFPITGNVGDVYAVNLTANDVSLENGNNGNTGKSVQLVKNFEVVDPYLSIESGDQNAVWPKVIGSYTDLNGAANNDLSDSVFQTYSGNQMKLDAVFHPASIENSTPISWKIDGYDFPDADNVKEISLPAAKDVDNTYDVVLDGLYTQPAEVKKALQNIWGISQFDSEDKNLNVDVQTEVVANPSVSEINSPKKFFAAIVNAAPENIIFLLRLFITIGILIFVSRLIFSLNPQNRSWNED